MAHLIRSAKSSKKWTPIDLESYHISVNQMDALAFFDLQELPQPLVHEELFNISDANLMQQDQHAELITLLPLAMIPNGRGRTAVNDFAVQLFKILGYVHRRQVARTQMDIPFLVCGKVKHAKADVCIIDHSPSNILLLVQEEKMLKLGDSITAPAQLIAKAIAAFDLNNLEREPLAFNLPHVAEKVMPGIVMVGTLPIFFKIPVTQALVTHVCNGTYPPEETHVTYCYPPVPRRPRQRIEGMEPLDNRHVILRCYEAFKLIVGI